MAIHLGFPRAFVDTHFSGWLSWFWDYRWEWSRPQSLYFLEHPFLLMVADKHRGVVLWGRWTRDQEGSAVPVEVFRFEDSDLCSLSWDSVSVTYVAVTTKYLATVTQGRRGLVWLMVPGDVAHHCELHDVVGHIACTVRKQREANGIAQMAFIWSKKPEWIFSIDLPQSIPHREGQQLVSMVIPVPLVHKENQPPQHFGLHSSSWYTWLL